MTGPDLKRLLAETSLPWKLHEGYAFVCDAQNRETADCGYGDGKPQHELIIAAVNALPALLAEREEALSLLRQAHGCICRHRDQYDSDGTVDHRVFLERDIGAFLAKHAAKPEPPEPTRPGWKQLEP